MIFSLQRALQQQLGVQGTQMFDSVPQFLGTAGLAIALGCVHAFTPGHGKSVVFSHFIGRDAHPAAGLGVGTVAATAHGVFAVLLVSLLGGAVSRFGRPVGAAAGVEVFSGVIVAAIGVWYLAKAITGGADHAHDRRDGRPRPLLGVAVGMLPCPLTMIVFAYALGSQALAAGLVQAGFVSVGAAMTIALIGTIAIASRRLGLKLLDPSRRSVRIVMQVIEIGSSAIVLLLGVLMLAAAFPRVA
ncbi:hypothetical protein FHP25_09460 [Vineibacter terrae]|uniref:Nickel/cobalt efflux system n=1 Tax=Vineibacter terrae TaxID=2586908 RepID=A0A5C8PR28_9HYPH|nr:hypothetical protein [Vineibacter terrae]TXL77643.1 hypothetical protein FHP25_09460 [Vineibacter terrae]